MSEKKNLAKSSLQIITQTMDKEIDKIEEMMEDCFKKYKKIIIEQQKRE